MVVDGGGVGGGVGGGDEASCWALKAMITSVLCWLLRKEQKVMKR